MRYHTSAPSKLLAQTHLVRSARGPYAHGPALRDVRAYPDRLDFPAARAMKDRPRHSLGRRLAWIVAPDAVIAILLR